MSAPAPICTSLKVKMRAGDTLLDDNDVPMRKDQVNGL